MDKPANLRLVLVGMTGAGKSSSGNTILGREAFKAAAGASSVTAECSKEKDRVFDREVSVVDTPGLFDTSLTGDYVKREIHRCINLSAPGPHAILLVIEVGNFTAEEQEAVQKVGEIFGEDAWRYSIILFTHGDKIEPESDFKEMLMDADDGLKEVLMKVENRYHVFNNNKANNRGQVLDLLQKVDEMVAVNRGEFHSNTTYQEVVKMLDQREKELEEFYKKQLEEQIKAVELKYEKMQKETQEEHQQVVERMESELQELRRYYKALESGVRYVVEQTAITTEDEELMKLSDETMKKFHETLSLN